MAKICLCLTANTINRDLKILNKYRKFTDLVELRVDCLDSDERLYIRRFPELAGMPVILTIRRDIDGGYFIGGEGARVKLLARGLAYANVDSRFNFAYVDIEDDFDVPSLEEAARTFGTRIIRSCHKFDGVINDIPAKIKSMQHSGDEIVKVAVTAKTTSDVLQVFRAAKTCADQEKILICMGHFGIYSRILAERFGSFLTYSSALSETEIPGAAGQLDVKELTELYRFRKISKKTKIYGVVGYPLMSSVSPWFFNTVFDLENTDAVYVPFPVNSIDNFLELAKELDIQGLSITVPYKESVLSGLEKCSAAVQSIGACNTMYRYEDGWVGENTDCTGFSDSLLYFLGRKNLKWQKITIIGAGGAARAVAAEIHRLDGKALILNRTVHKARSLAFQYNFRWGGLDKQGIELMLKYNDIIIQTSSVGMEGYETSDPLEIYNFSGNETVMDLIYTPAETAFLKRAAAAGCKTINGYDMVIRQACLQYGCFMGREIPKELLSRVNTSGANTWNKIRTG
ncbi:MAG: type I 3-dehydroquinate dehydratase [Treponema sp.]|jgi:3-dehydroquinate dehydratase/shikimate dehydrogenase|nr:type I 3-dehydroquinate dehydratase [Treponema sp.]